MLRRDLSDWIKNHKHLQGLHNQKKHGFRGSNAGQTASGPGSDPNVIAVPAINKYPAGTKMKLVSESITGTSQIAHSLVDDKGAVMAVSLDKNRLLKLASKNKLQVDDQGMSLDQSKKRMGAANNGPQKVVHGAQATGGAENRHQDKLKKGMDSVDKLDETVGAKQTAVGWDKIGTLSQVASDLNNIMEFAGLKAAKSPTPYKKGDPNTPETRMQRYSAYQAKIKSDLAALKNMMKSENKPNSKYVNMGDFDEINNQLGDILELIGGQK